MYFNKYPKYSPTMSLAHATLTYNTDVKANGEQQVKVTELTAIKAVYRLYTDCIILPICTPSPAVLASCIV